MKNNKVVIYSKKDCIYCQKAIKLLKNINVKYDEIKLNIENEEHIEWIKELKVMYNHHTFPFITVKLYNGNDIEDKFIGGYTDLERTYNTMYLHTLLEVEDDYIIF